MESNKLIIGNLYKVIDTMLMFKNGEETRIYVFPPQLMICLSKKHLQFNTYVFEFFVNGFTLEFYTTLTGCIEPLEEVS
jgi:hypothetical protein